MGKRKRPSDPNAELRAAAIARLAAGCSDRVLATDIVPGRCRFCGGPVPKGRRTRCSRECGFELDVRSNPGFARAMVHRRDRGRCELCNLDTDRLERIILRQRNMLAGAWGRRHGAGLYVEYKGQRIYGEHARARVFRLLGLAFECGHLWEMDHRVPVVEGGGACGLENLRTLCIWCHRLETRKLARRLARGRTTQADLFGERVLDADLQETSRRRTRPRVDPQRHGVDRWRYEGTSSRASQQDLFGGRDGKK